MGDTGRAIPDLAEARAYTRAFCTLVSNLEKTKRSSKELPAMALAVYVQVAKLLAGAFPHHGTIIINGSVSVRSTGVQLDKSCATDIPTESKTAAEQRKTKTFGAPI